MTLKWILNPAPLTEASDLNPMVTFFASTVIGRNADSFRPQNLLERERARLPSETLQFGLHPVGHTEIIFPQPSGHRKQ